MSIDQKYVQDQINALIFSVSQMANILNGTVNTNGGLNNTISGLYGVTNDLRKKYLMTYTGLSYRFTERKSVQALLDLITTSDLKASFVNEIREVLFRKNGYGEINSSNKVTIDSSNRITITVEINGDKVSSSFDITELVKEEDLVSIYEKLFNVNKRVVFNELGYMLDDFTKDPEQGILDTNTFNNIFEGVLHHSYTVEEFKAGITVNLSDTLFVSLTKRHLKAHDTYNIKMPFDKYLQLVQDVEIIRSKYDEIIDMYCTLHKDEE